LGCRADYAGGSKQWNLGIGNRINSRIINVLGPWCRKEQQQQPRPSIQHRLDRSAAKQASCSTQARWYKLGSSFVLSFSEHSAGGTKVPMIDVTQHFADVRKTCGWITSHRQVSTWSSFSPRCTSPPSAPSAHWSPSRRIASIAIIAQYPLPHCHDYGLALSCLSGNVAPLIGPVLPRHANPRSHPAPIPGSELSPQFIYWDGLYSLFELPAPLRKGSLFCTIWTILSVPSTRRN
jgi:hypothetical protein